MATKPKKSAREEIIAVKDLRENLPEYISRVSKGESFTVVKRSRPAFRITPPYVEEEWELIADFTKIDLRGISLDDLFEAL